MKQISIIKLIEIEGKVCCVRIGVHMLRVAGIGGVCVCVGGGGGGGG